MTPGWGNGTSPESLYRARTPGSSGLVSSGLHPIPFPSSILFPVLPLKYSAAVRMTTQWQSSWIKEPGSGLGAPLHSKQGKDFYKWKHVTDMTCKRSNMEMLKRHGSKTVIKVCKEPPKWKFSVYTQNQNVNCCIFVVSQCLKILFHLRYKIKWRSEKSEAWAGKHLLLWNCSIQAGKISHYLHTHIYTRGFLCGSVVKNTPAMQETPERLWSLGQEDPRRTRWQPTGAFLPRESHGQRSLAG